MNHPPRTLIVAGLLAALGFASIAQTPATTSPATPASAAQRDGHRAHDPARMEKRMARMQERMARRQAELKQNLQIAPAQESAWTSFTTAMKPAARPPRMDRESFARLSTPERIDQMRALRNSRIAEMDRRGEATKAFYATLTAEQKKVFDAQTVRRGHGGHHGHGHHHKG
jgi:hypothetical protein